MASPILTGFPSATLSTAASLSSSKRPLYTGSLSSINPSEWGWRTSLRMKTSVSIFPSVALQGAGELVGTGFQVLIRVFGQVTIQKR